MKSALSSALSKSLSAETSWLPYTQSVYDQDDDRYISKTLNHDEMSEYIVSKLKVVGEGRKELVSNELS